MIQKPRGAGHECLGGFFARYDGCLYAFPCCRGAVATPCCKIGWSSLRRRLVASPSVRAQPKNSIHTTVAIPPAPSAEIANVRLRLSDRTVACSIWLRTVSSRVASPPLASRPVSIVNFRKEDDLWPRASYRARHQTDKAMRPRGRERLQAARAIPWLHRLLRGQWREDSSAP